MTVLINIEQLDNNAKAKIKMKANKTLSPLTYDSLQCWIISQVLLSYHDCNKHKWPCTAFVIELYKIFLLELCSEHEW